jgi:hypothetical protein
MLAGLVVACVQPPPSDREDLPSPEVASHDTRASSDDPVSKKPECYIDSNSASPAEGTLSESGLTEQERRNVFRAVLDLRERALREAQKAFPTPEAQGIGGPGNVTKELAVESARLLQAESLERLYLGRFALGRQLSCAEVGRIFREGLEKGWTQP